MFKEERTVADGTIFFAVYDEDDPEKKPILKLDSKKTAKVITALLNADREQKSTFSLACMDAAKRLGCCPACESSNVESVMLLCHPPIIDLRCKNAGGGQGNLQIAFLQSAISVASPLRIVFAQLPTI